MTDRDALLRAVLAAPADDLPRLVFADWLDDRGDDRTAALIRGMIANRSEYPRSMTGPARRTVEIVTLQVHGFAALAARFGFDKYRVTRGFVSRVELPMAKFMRHAEELFRGHPITGVRLTDREPFEDDQSADYFEWALGEPWADNPELFEGADTLPRQFLVFDREIEDPVTSRAAALERLSAACVAYGRRLAGLSPLKENPPL